MRARPLRHAALQAIERSTHAVDRADSTKASGAPQNVARLTSRSVRKIIQFANVCDIFDTMYCRYTDVYGR
ncbi:hypothetical protein D7S86_24105 [Pararobbsia silviterrae]|uniref:Uncharacterized protein n=1 Tax=Pararobbsia silviterrae TaxID=1792498 RepID=A0A494X7A5_9BURK|nr:hypothetical protein D7S86_24105 [Pararobbsia silviterrae]